MKVSVTGVDRLEVPLQTDTGAPICFPTISRTGITTLEIALVGAIVYTSEHVALEAVRASGRVQSVPAVVSQTSSPSPRKSVSTIGKLSAICGCATQSARLIQ